MDKATSAVQQTEEKPHEGLQQITLDDIPQDGQRILQSYSGFASEDVLLHVLEIRAKGFELAQFSCIGQVKFLNNRLPKLPYCERFLHKLRAGGKLLDVGCGLGQELRYLAVNDGIDSSQLSGFDLDQRLIDLGFDLFRDRGRFKADMFGANLLAAAGEQPRLDALQGSMDLVQVSQVLHVFDWDDMFQAALRLVALGRAAPGTLIAGTQMGSKNPGSYPMPRRNFGTGKNYRHNKESMTRFWNEVGEATGSEWSVECAEIYSKAVEQNKNAWWAARVDPGGCMIYFCATRL